MSTEDRYLRGDYRARFPSWHREDAAWKAARIADMLDRNNLRPRTVIDVGCGTGHVLAEVGQRLPSAQRLVGYDIAPDAPDADLAHDDDRLELHPGVPPAGDRHDLLLCIDVVEHVEDYIGFLRGLRSLAARAIFHIPLDASAQAVVRSDPLLDLRSREGHLHPFTRETALATLATAGFEVLDWSYTRGSLERPPGSPLARAARLPRRALFTLSPDLASRLLGGFSLLVLAK